MLYCNDVWLVFPLDSEFICLIQPWPAKGFQNLAPGRLNLAQFLAIECYVSMPYSLMLLLLLLLSRFRRVRLCATPEMAAHQAPPSLGFSRQEYWSGLPFPSPMHESESEVIQLCSTLSDPMNCSLPGSSVHGIFQERVLEWGAIAFSDSLKRVS